MDEASLKMPGFFEKFIFEQEAHSYISISSSLAKQLMSLQKLFTILIFGSSIYTLLIPCRYTEMGDNLGCNSKKKHGEQTVLQDYLPDEDKSVRLTVLQDHLHHYDKGVREEANLFTF